LLHAARSSRRADAKVVEGTQHADRNAQFQYLNEQVKQFLAAGQPVVSMDAKKKELIGEFKNGGRDWQPQGWPERVYVHDFPDPHLGKAIPYGIYDVGRNAGWVTVGQDHDTASFAVATLRRWWQAVGAQAYPHADRLLICVDGGGSNGSRLRLWKVELQRFATDTGLQVTVCHLPPGTSKWNKIEHRLFAHISMNWRGRPLVSYEVVLHLIGATTTRSGLRVQAELDSARYPTKVKCPMLRWHGSRSCRTPFTATGTTRSRPPHRQRICKRYSVAGTNCRAPVVSLRMPRNVTWPVVTPAPQIPPHEPAARTA